MKIVEKPISTVLIHEIANMHRNQTEDEFQALKHSIEEIGQIEPVKLYRGKLVDGRHRLRAMKELGRETIKCEELNHRMSLKDVENTVIGTEQRRHDSAAQKAIRAYRWMKENGTTQEEAAIKFGTDRSNVSRAKRLEEMIGSELIDRFYSTGSVMIGGKEYSSLIRAVAAAKKLLDQEPASTTDKEEPSETVRDIYEKISNMAAFGDLVSLGKIRTFTDAKIKEMLSRDE